MTMRRWLIGIVALLALALGIWALTRHRPVPSSPNLSVTKSDGETPSQATFTIEGVEGLTLHQDGRKVWELFADTITLDKAQTQATAQGIRKAIYYDKQGRPLFWLSAQTLRYDANAGIVTVEGNLTVHAQLARQGGGRGAGDGEWVATAERAIWREREQVLEAFGVQGQSADTRCFVQRVRYVPSQTVMEGSGGVVLLRPNLQLTCPSVRANLSRRFYQAQPPVQVALWVGTQSPLPFTLTAQQPPANSPQSPAPSPQEKAKPQGKSKPRRIHLKTNHPVTILKGDELSAQEVIITEEGEDYIVTAKQALYNLQTEQVQVDGSVRFEDPETIATAPKAQIDARRRIATFFGPVEVTIKPKTERSEGQGTEGEKKKGNEGAPKSSPNQSPAPDPQSIKGKGQGAGNQQPSEQPTPKPAEKSAEQQAPNSAEKSAEPPAPQKRESFRERVRRRGGKLICEQAEYDYRERRVVATGNVQFEQPGRYKGRADKLTYLTRDEVLILEGNIIVDDVRKGHRVQCPRAVINLKTDDAHFDPPVSAELIVTEEEETPKKEEAPKKEAPKETPKEEKPKEEAPKKEAPKPTEEPKGNGSGR
ncbi:MAG: hypothetical protein PVTTEEND_001612 [Candidatus Fervidibacter sp.]|jgi:Organic solvent tolerance protein OstA